MKPLLFREVKRKLEAAGFVEVGQTLVRVDHCARMRLGRFR